MKKKDDKNKGLFLSLTKEEEKMVDVMKEKYAVNMSQFIRNAIRDFYDKMEGGN